MTSSTNLNPDFNIANTSAASQPDFTAAERARLAENRRRHLRSYILSRPLVWAQWLMWTYIRTVTIMALIALETFLVLQVWCIFINGM